MTRTLPSTAAAAALQIETLCAGYGGGQTLFDVCLTVPPGSVTALLGRNGAGKSTTLKAIMGLIRPFRGTVRLFGQPVTGMAPHRLCRLGLGYVPEERRVFPELTVAENLEVGRRGEGRAALDLVFDLFPALADLRDRPAGRTSGGEQQMLAVARTLMGRPRVLLLDEPSEGLAPRVVNRLADAVLSLKAEGLTILLSEQNRGFTRRVADRAALIDSGRIRATGSVQDVAGAEESATTPVER